MGRPTKFYLDMNATYGARNYNPLPVVIEEGNGVWATDVEGKKYLDCLSAYSALNYGYCHPRILNVLVAQASKLPVVSRAYLNSQMTLFFRELAKLCKKKKVLPMNTGAEAVETAIKIARKWGYTKKKLAVKRNKAEIITFKNNFHGRTTTIVSFSTEDQYKDGFGPFTPGFPSVTYGDIEAVRRAVTKNTVAVLVEPIQGEAGIVLPPQGFLRALRDLCTEQNILMIADEVQTGLGRTGALFACDHEEVVPDLYILGKALGGGFYPVSAVVGNDDVMGVLTPGDHGSTFGGNPLACAIARESLCVLIEENLSKRAAAMGLYFMAALRGINSPYVKEIRGKGLLIGVELTKAAGLARPFCEKLVKVGILSKETHESVIRFAPPLIIDYPTIDWAIERIKKVLTEPL